MDLRPLRVSCGVWHGVFYSGSWVLYVGGWGLHGSDLLQHVLQMPFQIRIWGIWRPGQQLGPFIAVPEQCLHVSGHTDLLGPGATAIR